MSRHGPFPIAHPSTRNPWIAQNCSESVSSSASSQTYHVIPTNHYVQMEPYWEEGYIMAPPVRHPQEMPPQPAMTQTGVYLLPKQNVPRNHYSVASESVGERRSRPDSSRAITPTTSGHGVGPTETAVLPCGGHCVPLETFCHHFLQIGFVAGILAGICLIVAGSVFGGRSGDLGVLIYIGVLTSLVSALLLSIQCCSKARPRPRRHRQAREEIPMRDLPPLQPLLTKIVHQQISHDQHQFRDESGIPWWRRENQNAV